MKSCEPGLTPHLDGSYDVEGVAGRYTVTQVGRFYRVNYLPGWGKARTRDPQSPRIAFVGSIPVGNYESPGVRAQGNPDARKNIEAAILRHAGQLTAP